MFVEIVLFFALIVVVFIYFNNKRHERYKSFGIPYNNPIIVLLETLFKRIHLTDNITKMYNEIGDKRCRFVGVGSFMSPVLLLKDPKIIKQILVKEFDNFSEHQSAVTDDTEPILSKMLVSLKGQMWRDMRAALSPAFTSSKIKDMCPLISECGNQMNNYLEGKENVEVDVRDLTTRFMSDVIATTAFGIKVDSFEDKDNDFFVMGSEVTGTNLTKILKSLVIMLLPKIAKFFKIKAFPEKLDIFFTELLVNSMKHREENNIVRRDMIHLLMQAKKGSLKHDSHTGNDSGFAAVEESEIGTTESKREWTDIELVAQAFLFFLAGFETTSTLMTFLLYEIALSPEIQLKLREEVDNNVEHGNVTYEMIQRMKYLDMVISEGLRRWPPAVLTDRWCVGKSVDIGPLRPGENKTFTVMKGEGVWIPIYALHVDPTYFPDPLKFNPERFSDENKGNIEPFTYLPFGGGPRNCIASRFAIIEAKMMLCHLISKFDIQPGPKTKAPLVVDQKSFNMRVPPEYSLRFISRKNEN